MAGTPIELKLYDADDNVTRTLIRSVVPWGLMKRAMRMAKVLSQAGDNLSETSLDELTGFIVAVFGDKVTPEELETGADTGDMIAVMNQVVAKAQALMPNPNPPGPAR